VFSDRIELPDMTAEQRVAHIEPVKLLGTSWYRRGPGYWARRFGLSVTYLLLAAGAGAVSVLLVRVFWADRKPVPLAVVVTVVGVVATVWTAAVTVRAYRRAERTAQRRRRTPGPTGLLGVARTLGFVMVAVVFCVFIAFGGMAATFGYSLRPEFFGEHQARLRHRDQGEGRRR
jgi:hypothetical protein